MSTNEGYALEARGGSGDYVWTVLPVAEVKTCDVVSLSPEGVLIAKVCLFYKLVISSTHPRVSKSCL